MKDSDVKTKEKYDLILSAMLKSSVGTDCLKCNKVISIFPDRF